jgi:hypothetical protein
MEKFIRLSTGVRKVKPGKGSDSQFHLMPGHFNKTFCGVILPSDFGLIYPFVEFVFQHNLSFSVIYCL